MWAFLQRQHWWELASACGTIGSLVPFPPEWKLPESRGLASFCPAGLPPQGLAQSRD